MVIFWSKVFREIIKADCFSGSSKIFLLLNFKLNFFKFQTCQVFLKPVRFNAFI